MLVHCLLVLQLFVGVLCLIRVLLCSTWCLLSIFAIILLRNKELVVFLVYCGCKCSEALLRGAMGWLQCAYVVFHGHTHLLFKILKKFKN